MAASFKSESLWGRTGATAVSRVVSCPASSSFLGLVLRTRASFGWTRSRRWGEPCAQSALGRARVLACWLEMSSRRFLHAASGFGMVDGNIELGALGRAGGSSSR